MSVSAHPRVRSVVDPQQKLCVLGRGIYPLGASVSHLRSGDVIMIRPLGCWEDSERVQRQHPVQCLGQGAGAATEAG